MNEGTDVLDAELTHLETLWDGRLGDAYRHYATSAPPRLALAAALVESGIVLHGLGSHLASPGNLLLGDLCLARASRLVAEEAGRETQIGFARAIERAATHAATGLGSASVRTLLTAVIEGRSP